MSALRRLLAAVAVVAVFAEGVGATSTAQQPGVVFPQAVDMTVDYPGKTITIKARIDFYQAAGTRPDPTLVKSIVDAITAAWNGHKFKCFNVVVEVDAGTVNGKPAVRGNAVDIKLDNRRIKAHSKVVGTSGGDVLSDDPANRLTPGRETGAETMSPTSWGKYTDSSVWAHEFGHVLGLDDNYDHTDGSKVVPGAPKDIMFSQGFEVSAETITKLVRRNNTGQLDENRIRCPLSMDAGPASINVFFLEVKDLTVEAYTCDYDAPSVDPARRPAPTSWTGTASGTGSFNFGPLGSGSSGATGAIAFTSEAEKEYAFSLVTAGGSIDFAGTYRWGTHGVPVNIGPLKLFGTSSSAVGLGLYPVFTEGAPECPP